MGGTRKQYLDLGGRPVLLRALEPFLGDPRVEAMVIALPAEDVSRPPAWLGELDSRIRLVPGGGTRLESVRAALEALPVDVDVILVHDGVRPLVSADVVDRCIREAASGRGAVAGYPAVDTLKEVDARGTVRRTPDRSALWHAQTPQAFPRNVLLRAYAAADPSAGATDCAQVVERWGGEVRMVEGSPRNIKVTRAEDLLLAELFLRLHGE